MTEFSFLGEMSLKWDDRTSWRESVRSVSDGKRVTGNKQRCYPSNLPVCVTDVWQASFPPHWHAGWLYFLLLSEKSKIGRCWQVKGGKQSRHLVVRFLVMFLVKCVEFAQEAHVHGTLLHEGAHAKPEAVEEGEVVFHHIGSWVTRMGVVPLVWTEPMARGERVFIWTLQLTQTFLDQKWRKMNMKNKKLHPFNTVLTKQVHGRRCSS